MAGNDNASFCSGKVEIKRGQVVDDVDVNRTQMKQLCLLQAACPSAFVVVASDSRDGSDCLELFDNLRAANISRMDDVVTALKECPGFRPQQSMSIRDETYAKQRNGRLKLTWLIKMNPAVVR